MENVRFALTLYNSGITKNERNEFIMQTFSPNNMSQFIFKLEIEDFYNYIEVMEANLNMNKSRIEEMFEEQSAQFTDEETKQEFYEHVFFDEYYQLENTHSLILRKSLFITLYSFMETNLRSLATKLENHNLSNIKLKDIKHKGAHKYFFYISTVHEIETNLTKSFISKLLTYNSLRNYFVHDNQDPIEKEKYYSFRKLRGTVFEKFPKMGEDDKEIYHMEKLEKEFNEEYLNQISILFGELFKSFEANNIRI